LVCLWAVSARAADTPLLTIKLEQVGYQHVPCEVIWQGEDYYPNRRIEFLDGKHLLVHFVTSDVCNDNRATAKPTLAAPPFHENHFHSAVIDLSGHLIHSYDWQLGDDVIAGPDGNVLVVRADGVRIVDQTFKTIQTTPWQQQGIPAPLRVLVTPSRHGFAIDDRKHAALFVGPPYKEAATTTSSVVAGISDSGFMTWSGFNPGPPVLHVNGVEWSAPIHPSLSGLLAIGENEVLGLDQKHTLYRFDQRGDEALVVKLGSLTPGMWNSGFRFEQTLPDAARVLFFSHGARIAFTDSSGLVLFSNRSFGPKNKQSCFSFQRTSW
jgi:hypothetical protein